MNEAVTVGLFGVAAVAFSWVIGASLCTMVRREVRRGQFAARDQLAVETLNALLRLQESSHAAWRQMAEVAASTPRERIGSP